MLEGDEPDTGSPGSSRADAEDVVSLPDGVVGAEGDDEDDGEE